MNKIAELGSPAFKHDGSVRAVAVTPDGKRIVSAGEGVIVWDAATGAPIGELTGERGFYTLAISPDGTRVLAAGNAVEVYDLRTKQRLFAPKVKKPLVVAAGFLPDGGFVFGDDRTPRRFDAYGKELAPLVSHRGGIEALAIARHGRRALTCGSRTLKLHDLTGEPTVVATWEGDARDCGFSPDGTLAWTVGYFHATVRGIASGKVLFHEELAQMRHGALSADGARFAIATEDAIHIFAQPGKQQIARIEFVADALAFTPDGERLVVANDGRGRGDCGIAVFDIAGERRLLPADTGHTGAITGLAAPAAMPHAVFSIGADGAIVMWDAQIGEPLERIGTVDGEGRAIVASADGEWLVTASSGAGPRLWNVRRTEAMPLPGDGYSGLAVALSPSGTYVAYLSYAPRNLQVFERATQALVLQTKPARAHRAGALAWVADDVVASTKNDGAVIVQRVPDGARLWSTAVASFVNAVCVAGDALIAGGSDGSLAVFAAATGEQRAVLREAGREIHHACTVDAAHVAVLRRSDDFDRSTVELWSLGTRGVVARADLGTAARAVAASPDGRRVYVGTNTSRVVIFERS